jgi:hypothetical protein
MPQDEAAWKQKVDANMQQDYVLKQAANLKQSAQKTN